ncbi:LysR family transcriptional regulator [Roseobacter weihaiensis]|uniref:LysR family transcriptional regulator n=1 Tax=Roseobacter weihaiensis TaxID=2763262 RepID=UPI001D09BB01|nr:LysR family transcriptional regulator [Roseobacter sp. H9]
MSKRNDSLELGKSFSLQDFHVLLAVAETGSFRKAGQTIGIGQSAVTRRVRKLEDSLGVSLFERRPSGAKVTNAGSRFVSRTRTIVDDFKAAMETAQAAGFAGNGHLRIGLIVSLSHGATRDLFAGFAKAHPDVDLCLVESDRSELMTLLSHRSIDVVISAGPPVPEYGEGLILTEEKIWLAVPSDRQIAERDLISWEDIRTETFVVGAREPGPEIHDFIMSKVGSFARRPVVRRHRLSRGGIMNLVGLGLGVSLVCDHWRGIRYPNVSFVPIGSFTERVPFSLIWRPENDNPALRRFISLARVEAKRNGVLS